MPKQNEFRKQKFNVRLKSGEVCSIPYTIRKQSYRARLQSPTLDLKERNQETIENPAADQLCALIVRGARIIR